MKNGALEGTEMVSGDRFVVGRDAACAVVLDDPSIGAQHLGVFVHDGKLAVQNLGATGTRVNGELITGPRYIGPREDVAVGVFTIKLKLMGAAGPRASSPPVAAPVEAAKPALAAAPPVVRPALSSNTPANETTALKPSPQAPSAQGHNVTLGQANLELTAPGLAPPVPITEPPAPRGISADADDETTLIEDQPRKPPNPLVAATATLTGSVTAPDAIPALGLPPSLLQAPSAPESGPLAFAPFIDDEPDDEDVALPWSLVQRLVRPPEGNAGKHPVIEVVHYRGEHVVDHKVITDGGKFVLGAGWSRAERQERGLDKALALVRLRKDGVAEILQSPAVAGKLLRQGVQTDLPGSGTATPIVDGELCSLRIGTERVFVRFAGVPALLWSKEDIAEAQAQRRLTTVSTSASLAFFAFFLFLSWIYGYRSKNEDIIDLEDDGFAEIIEKDLSFVEPPKPEKPPEPVKTAQPVPEKAEPKTTPTAKTDPVPDAPAKEAPKPGLASMLANIPKVNDTASNQNLSAALSNIKGVRVPGDASGFKTSALTGKGPSSGVQIGGAAGGLATSGINSLIRNDGAAGALGGKGDRQVAGKVTTQPRLSQVKGSGELSKDEIQRVINAHVGEIQYCYEKQLRSNAGLAGRVVLEWTVTSSGGVSVVKVATSSLSSNDATKCMMDRVKNWKFPKPRGNAAVTVVYPFVFNTI